MTTRLHRGDLPDVSRYGREVAIDTETMGLHPHRDRLCVVQLSFGDGNAELVQIARGQTEAPNLVKLLQDHVKATIAPYKYPRRILFVAALPKTSTGKIRERWWRILLAE